MAGSAKGRGLKEHVLNPDDRAALQALVPLAGCAWRGHDLRALLRRATEVWHRGVRTVRDGRGVDGGRFDGLLQRFAVASKRSDHQPRPDSNGDSIAGRGFPAGLRERLCKAAGEGVATLCAGTTCTLGRRHRGSAVQHYVVG